MTKRDRVAVVVTLIYSFIIFGWLFNGLKPMGLVVFFLPVLLYWGYRFIQGDISFLAVKKGGDE